MSYSGIVVIILFFPGHLSDKKLNVEETKYYYEGSFRNGFSEKTLFGKTNVIITEYTKVETDTQNVILLIPDKRGDTQAYTEYLQLLAQEGNRVFSADFFTEDAKYLDTPGETRYTRQFLFVLYQLLGRTDFYSQKEKLAFNVTQEIEGVLDILEKDFEITGPVFLVTDEMSAPACSLYKMKNRQKISGSFNLASASAYQTPGYGFITFNNPLVAKLLGYSVDRSKSQLEDTVAETINTMVK